MYRVKSVNVRDEAMRPAHCPTPDRSFESRYYDPPAFCGLGHKKPIRMN
jgi:hypothetical protein